uniref:AAA ATPase n=1 Tax=Caulobacter sp. (strain K31) TaxID=366602 RepID=B0T902_CAUSK
MDVENSPQSSELAAGAGFTFEDAVTARYLAALLGGAPAPGVEDGLGVVRVLQQQRNRAEPLDDLVVDFASDDQDARLRLQVKSALTVSSAPSNTDFRAIVRDSWRTLRKPEFRLGQDRFGAAVFEINAQRLRDVGRLCARARGQIDPATFAAPFAPDGEAPADLRLVYDAFTAALQAELGASPSPEDLHALLSHFVLLRFDLNHPAAVDTAPILANLQGLTAEGTPASALVAWIRLLTLARAGGAVNRVYDRAALGREVAALVRLAAQPSLRADLARLETLVGETLSQIQDDVQGARLQRPRLDKAVDEALAKFRFVRIRGLPGSGKSVVLRRQVETARQRGPVLFLKADALEETSWTAFATAHGLRASAKTLLAEIGTIGAPILFIDGLDRVELSSRPIIKTLVNAIVEDPDLAAWRVVASLRDSGVEPVRTWLPDGLVQAGVGDVFAEDLDDDEAKALAELRPNLSPLLIGDLPVTAIARRPFFAKILAHSVPASAEALASESDLITHWWRRGGFDAEGAQALRRRRALIELGQVKLSRISAPIALRRLGEATIDTLEDLVTDGVLAWVSEGHSVRFAHDIFFEWSLLHTLIDQDSDWLEAVRAAGEPPALGRVVELLAQRRFVDDDGWTQTLSRIEAAGMRPQWTRAWLLGPLSSASFTGLEDRYAQVVLDQDSRLLKPALVWFQAEKTTPHPAILAGKLGPATADPQERARLADMLSWPSDPATWQRLIGLLLASAPQLPHRLIPEVVAIFEVWQNLAAKTPNPASDLIVEQIDLWLGEIEAFYDEPSARAGFASPWNGLEGLDSLDQTLRRLLLRAAGLAPARVSAYLRRVDLSSHRNHKRFTEIVGLSALLARTHAAELADLTLRRLKGELPADQVAREEADYRRGQEVRAAALAIPEAERTPEQQHAADGMFSIFGYRGVDDHHWDTLGLEEDRALFYPASPLREPFRSLLEHRADEALRLIAGLSDHAMTAWRQMHALIDEEPTPLPIDIVFAWGAQRFWGDAQVYGWHRGGTFAPAPLDSAYLALEAWAIGQLEAGADPNVLIQRILADNPSVAVLGVALAVAHHLETPPLAIWPVATCQRLWAMDRDRLIADMTGQFSDRFGFSGDKDADHREALAAAANRPARSKDARHLAAAFVWHGDEALSARTRQAIQAFGQDPPFDFAEDRDDPDTVFQAQAAATGYAAWGDLEAYRRGQDPDTPGGQVLYGPEIAKPEAPEETAQNRLWMLGHHLCGVAEKAIKAGAPIGAAAVEEALAAARELDRADLFTAPEQNDRPDAGPGGVAAVAAVILVLEPDAGEARAWARAILQRATDAPEHRGLYWSPTAHIAWHPGLFAAHGLAALLRADPEDADARARLLGLVAHPLEQVAFAALDQAYGLWATDPRLSWCAMGLGLSLAVLPRQPRGANDPTLSDQARARALRAALAGYEGAEPWPALTLPDRDRAVAPALEEEDDDPADHGRFVRNVAIDSPAWRGGAIRWHGDFAAAVLQHAPVRSILASPAKDAFVSFAGAAVAWTVERLTPGEAARKARRQPNRGGLHGWVAATGRLAGQVCGALDASEAKATLLTPILGLDRDQRDWLLAPLVEYGTAIYLYDAPQPPEAIFEILDACLETLLADPELRRGSYRAGELHSGEQRRVLESLMLVDDAALASRFAQGDWRAFDRIKPTVERLVREAGWASPVASNFVKLAERAKGVVSADWLADQILTILAEPETAQTWRSTLLPARVADLVQHLAEQQTPLEARLSQKLLRILDALIDMGDRRSAALQQTEAFREVQLVVMPAS